MRFSYRLQKETTGWLAQCVESDAMGEGKTEQEAVRSLHESLAERMFRPDAVAPPEHTAESPIDLVPAGHETAPDSLDLGGPGG